jgi:hypothetical protein
LAWYHANKARAYANEKARLATPEGHAKKRASVRKHYAESPEVRWKARQSIDKRKRLLRYHVPGSHTQEEWLAKIASCNNECYICHRPFTAELPPTRDHVIPVSAGGSFIRLH